MSWIEGCRGEEIPPAWEGIEACEECSIGDLNVSVAIRGRSEDFFLDCCSSLTFCDGKSYVSSEILGSCEGPSFSSVSREKRSLIYRPDAAIRMLTVGFADFRTVPLSSSVSFSLFSITKSNAGTAFGEREVLRVGRTDGADMSPTHSRLIMATSIEISCINKPRMLKTRILPVCVPIAISVSGLSNTAPESSVALPPNRTSLSPVPLGCTGDFENIERQVAGPETCYVRSIFAPPAKSTSRQRPSCPILTIRAAYPGMNSVAVIPPIAALCSLLMKSMRMGSSWNDCICCACDAVWRFESAGKNKRYIPRPPSRKPRTSLIRDDCVGPSQS